MSNPGNSAEPLSLGEAANVDTLVIGTSPSESFALLDAVMTEALGLAMYNAVTAQQNASTARNATVLMACAAMLSLPIADIAGSSAQASARAAADQQAGSAKKTPAPVATPPEQRAAAASAGAAAAKGNSSTAPGAGRTVDPQIIDAINQIQTAVLSPQVVLTSGAGKAYQLVAIGRHRSAGRRRRAARRLDRRSNGGQRGNDPVSDQRRPEISARHHRRARHDGERDRRFCKSQPGRRRSTQGIPERLTAAS
jgi:hypothetical protein